MKGLKIFIYVLVFFVVGELLIRIDLRYDLLDKSPQKIEIKVEDSQIIRDVEHGIFEAQSDQIRILVIGDSYIHGGGINSSDKFSSKLSQLLKRSNLIKEEILILDVSRPSNNTLDNYNSFMYYQTNFKPQFVFWAYNFNDIIGDIKLEEKHPSKVTKNISTPPIRIPNQSVGIKKVMKNIYSFSELIRYLSSKAQKELKLKGIVLPVGDFYYLTKEAYKENSDSWKETQKVLSEASRVCQLNHTEFIIYKMPEFNLLNKMELFAQIDSALLKFCRSIEYIKYIDGNDDFHHEDGSNFMLSKYDGHPNEKAHLKMAEEMAKLVEKRLTINRASYGAQHPVMKPQLN